MVSGAFKWFKHEHIFLAENDQTLMIDKFHFESPFGVFGKLINTLFLKRYMTQLLKTRNLHLKAEAERLHGK